jgi:hypothetical protein
MHRPNPKTARLISHLLAAALLSAISANYAAPATTTADPTQKPGSMTLQKNLLQAPAPKLAPGVKIEAATKPRQTPEPRIKPAALPRPVTTPQQTRPTQVPVLKPLREMTPGKAELAVVNVAPLERGPFYADTHTRVRVTIRNNGTASGHVKVGIVGRGARLDSESRQSRRIAAGRSASLEMDVNIHPGKVNDDEFRETVHLLDADVSPAQGVLKRAWKDDRNEDNTRSFRLPVTAGVYKVRVDVISFKVNSICHDNPGEDDKWFFSFYVSRTRNTNVSDYGLSERPLHLRWPNKFTVVHEQQTVTPRVHLSRTGFDNNSWLLASLHMDQTYDRMGFQWDQVRNPGQSYLKLSPEQWRRGGLFTTQAQVQRPKNHNSCNDGSYTVTWRVRATPEALH